MVFYHKCVLAFSQKYRFLFFFFLHFQPPAVPGCAGMSNVSKARLACSVVLVDRDSLC